MAKNNNKQTNKSIKSSNIFGIKYQKQFEQRRLTNNFLWLLLQNRLFFFFFFFLLFLIQYNKYNTIIQHISAPVPTVDNTRIQIYMLMLYIHNRQKRYIHTDIHTDKELDKVLHRQIFALHKA